MKERTLVLIKPDGVARGLVGEILTRFERAGLKIVAMKLVQSDRARALMHYTEDIAQRRGQHVRDQLVDFLQQGPVVALVLEGVHAIALVRKMVGGTEPHSALPGTIRGDYAHVSFKYADDKNIVVKNLIHASSDENDAKNEVTVWFAPEEMHSYKLAHDSEILE